MEKPYIEKKKIVIQRSYNPKYGDKRVCECGHDQVEKYARRSARHLKRFVSSQATKGNQMRLSEKKTTELYAAIA